MKNSGLAQKEFIRSYKRHMKLVTLLRVIILVLIIALWEIAARTGLIDAFIFSSPYRILMSFIYMIGDGALFYHIGVTVVETLVSFFLVMFFGILIAILLWNSKSIAEVCEPYLVVLNSLPKSALAPVLIVWLGNNIKTIIFAAILVAVFGTIINIYTSFREVDPDKIKLIYTLGGKKKDVLRKVIIPSSTNVIISNMKVNIGLSLVGVIIGEFLAANAGLGYLIIYGSQVFKLDLVLMSIVILMTLAGILYKAIAIVEKRFSID